MICLNDPHKSINLLVDSVYAWLDSVMNYLSDPGYLLVSKRLSLPSSTKEQQIHSRARQFGSELRHRALRKVCDPMPASARNFQSRLGLITTLIMT